MGTQITLLTSCTCSIKSELFGRSLTKDIRWASESVVRSVASLMNSLCASEQPNLKEYTFHIGIIHEAIDRARQVSRSNIEAVKKIWESVAGGLEDGIAEVQEMLENKGSIDEEEWDDLDFAPQGESAEFTEVELGRISAVRSRRLNNLSSSENALFSGTQVAAAISCIEQESTFIARRAQRSLV